MIDDIPKKTSKGSLYIEKPRRFDSIKLDVHLRRLLILIDGKRSVRELLEQGIKGVDESCFQALFRLDLIQMVSDPDEPPKSVGYTQELKEVKERGLTSARFAILDVLIDISASDFSLRPWIEHFEKAKSTTELAELIEVFAVSKTGKKHPRIAHHLRMLLG